MFNWQFAPQGRRFNRTRFGSCDRQKFCMVIVWPDIGCEELELKGESLRYACYTGADSSAICDLTTARRRWRGLGNEPYQRLEVLALPPASLPIFRTRPLPRGSGRTTQKPSFVPLLLLTRSQSDMSSNEGKVTRLVAERQPESA